MRLLAFVFAAFLASCSLGPPAPPASEDMQEVKFWHDVARGVGCWIWYGTGRGGISCLPDAQYISAPRSPSEVPPEPAGQEWAQAASGAPSAGVAQSAEHSVTGYPVGERVGATPAPGLGVSFAQTHIGTAAGTIRGVASYYGTGPAGVAAAGPNLRAALGRNWRGTWVRVTYAFTEMDSRGRVRHRGRSAWLRLGDACWCRVADIDIPTRTFSYLSRGELWRGLLRVTITWGDVPRLPQTDAAP